MKGAAPVEPRIASKSDQAEGKDDRDQPPLLILNDKLNKLRS